MNTNRFIEVLKDNGDLPIVLEIAAMALQKQSFAAMVAEELDLDEEFLEYLRDQLIGHLNT